MYIYAKINVYLYIIEKIPIGKILWRFKIMYIYTRLTRCEEYACWYQSFLFTHADRGEWDKFDAMWKLADSNSMLNRAFRQGQKARKGRTHKTFGGETYTDGTGTNSDAFKRLK
jgi:hypothetical protein